jgi:excisionase family DNA binding protein
MTDIQELAAAVADEVLRRLDERLPPPEQVEPEYITLAEVARRTSFSKDFVYDAVWAGELPAVQKGREWRVAVSDMRAWMDRDRAGQTLPARSKLRGKIDELMPGLKA